MDISSTPNGSRTRIRGTAPAATARLLALGTAFALALASPGGAAEGKYSRRREARGDVADTSPKLDAWAFFEDANASGRGLSLLVDAWAARQAEGTRLVPLLVGLEYDGTGESIPLRPWTFVLSWEGGTASGLAVEELRSIDGWQTLLRRHRQRLGSRPKRFDPARSSPVSVTFYPNPPTSAWVSTNARLVPGACFTDLLYFRLPEGVDPWSTLFSLAHVPCAPPPPGARAPPDQPPLPCDPSVTATFRIERDPELHQRAFRRARREQARKPPPER